MTKALEVKICGLSTIESIESAINAGADYIGLVFHPKSPRYVTLDQAHRLADHARGRIKIVALVVDAEDSVLSAILSHIQPDFWQFHGQERFERLRDCRAVFGLPIIKAIGVATRDDLSQVTAYHGVADRLLLDAKPPKDAPYPGGHGSPFDWDLLSALDPRIPFMLSGGLSPENCGAAITKIKAMGLAITGVDLSSGVESAPGVKDTVKIRAFLAAMGQAQNVMGKAQKV
jgi:phosphoribosylanthranilate isomerase